MARTRGATALLLALVLAAAPRQARGEAPGPGVVHGTVEIEGARDGPVLVYVKQVDEPPPEAAERARIAQQNTRFLPDVLVVLQGTKVDFPNDDLFYHNVFSLTPGNEFDLGLYRGGVSKAATMKEPGEVEVYCNVHEKMAATILVLQNRHYVEVGADGAFRLEGVPPGRRILVAWSRGHEPVEIEIDVGASKTPAPKLSLKPRAKKRHLNKHGEEYGRYK